ncbi:hypothetical protein ACHAPJ_013154 [Fusarium lateritium]
MLATPIAPNFGKNGEHKVAIPVLPMGEYGTASAVDVTVNMCRSFPNIRIGLMVGIGRGAPSPTRDIRPGDVVVSVTPAGQGGVFRYVFGKSIQEKSFQQTRILNQRPQALLAVVATLESDHMIDGNGIEDAIKETLQRNSRLEKDFSRPHESKDILFQSTFVHMPHSDSCHSCHSDTANVVRREDRTKDDTGTQVHYGTITSANTLMKNAIGDMNALVM